MSLLQRLTRVTSSGRFIPEIDGMRFIAIFSVVLFHLNGFMLQRNVHEYVDAAGDYQLFNIFLSHGHYGVQLFFVISGMILGLPFANHYINGARKPQTKAYFIRRITRLEPPYIIAMVGLFFAAVFVANKYSFSELFPSLLQSLTYTHNFFHGREILPLVNCVAWSLEIEVQFYILAPLLATVFMLPARKRRTVLLLAVFVVILLQQLYQPPFKSLYDYIQFFAAGFLLADLYVSKTTVRISGGFAKVLGVILICGIWTTEMERHDPYLLRVAWNVLLVSMITVFYYLVLNIRFWKRIFSIKLVTVLGGMCYTIYLLHYAAISLIGNKLVVFQFTNLYIVDWLIHASLITTILVMISVVYFYTIERPCMVKNWHVKLYHRLISRDRLGLQTD
jgi:peptidoglycan/LPS O-acetylase OafA/YrhL